MADPVRIGIVGCGSVMNAYMRLIKELREQNAVVVMRACDVNEDQQKRVQAQYGISQVTDDYESVVQASDVDLVLVLTSMPDHGPITRAALEAGKHVLVEKPMAVDLETAAELVTIAQQSKGYLVPAPHVVLSPTFQTISKRIYGGDIGQVVLARAQYGWAGPSWGPWFYKEGGGALFDLGVYNVTSLTALLGPAKRVTAMAGVAIPERVVDGEMMRVEAEDNMHLLMDFGASVFAVVTTGFTMQKARGPSIELYGTEGTLQLMGYDWGPDGYELWQNDVGAWQIFGEMARSWPWTDGLRHVVECIQGNVRPLITPEHGYHVLEVMIKSKDAGKDGIAREIESTFTPPRFEDPDEQEAPHLVHDSRIKR